MAVASSSVSSMTVGTSTCGGEPSLVSAHTATAASARRISARIAIRPRLQNRRSSGGASGGGGGVVPAAAATAAYEAVSPMAAPEGSASAASRAWENSSADANRFAGSFARARITTPSRARETAGFSSLGGRGRSDTCFRATDTGESASNGTLPVSVS
jgi:hypothetical protein